MGEMGDLGIGCVLGLVGGDAGVRGCGWGLDTGLDMGLGRVAGAVGQQKSVTRDSAGQEHRGDDKTERWVSATRRKTENGIRSCARSFVKKEKAIDI